ncbi:hypothetical protein EV401DRAFT_364663 [Pisolithus croceorrhizus]|nr:hypothetical protein EV401DRAFT_364663 [Pisolithus croceorrhizus]
MSCAPQTPEEVLASVSSLSKRTLLCGKSSPDTSHFATNHNPDVPPESIQVPRPPPLLTPLLEAGAPQHVAQEMHTSYLQCAKKLRTHYATAISRLRKELPGLPADSVSAFNDQLTPLFLRLYTKSLQDWVRYEVDMFRARRPPGHKKSSNQTFNHDYLPLLEHFFDQNPFPTHADKASLARKSDMSYQQIHVWFQNRRSRSRKVGKVLRKKSMSPDTTLPICVDTCETKSDGTIVDESCRDESKMFNPLRPSDHCAMSRFRRSSQAELKFDPSLWPRRPSLAKSGRSSCDVDGLVEKLSQLSVRDRASGRGKKHQDGLHYPLAATSSITIMPPPAPHPALIRSQNISLPPLPPLVVPRTGASRSTRLQAFNAPNSSSPSNLLASSVVSHFPEPPRERRKVISNDSFHRETTSLRRVQTTFKCGLAPSRIPQRVPHSGSCLSTNTTPNYVPPEDGTPWVFPVRLEDRSLATARAFSRHAIAPWDFRLAVTV